MVCDNVIIQFDILLTKYPYNENLPYTGRKYQSNQLLDPDQSYNKMSQFLTQFDRLVSIYQ